MELGEKIRQARLDAGLSQRQLCGGEITRNMLSLIEHGSAQPSMKTLQYLAQQLGKPLSWFLDEDAEAGSAVTQAISLLRKAEQAVSEGRDVYAGELLAQISDPYPEILRQKLLLSARLPGADIVEICNILPSLDEELLLRARAAMANGDLNRCQQLLGAVEDQTTPLWNLLFGTLWHRLGEYDRAIPFLQNAEEVFPDESITALEICYRELGNFEQAYYYACKRRT